MHSPVKTTARLVFSILILLLSMPAQAQKPASFDLEDFRWKNRVLLVFAPAADDSAFQALTRQIEQRRQDFDERDMLLVAVLAEGPSRAGAEALPPDAAAGLRDAFGIAEAQFAVLLIGKDGGVKRRAEQLTDLSDILALIDTMPMRQREMQQQR